MAKLTNEELEFMKKILEKANSEDTKEIVPERKGRPVIVCNAARSVYFGYTEDTSKDVIKLFNARSIWNWVAPKKGIFGLASDGPGKGSRVGAVADCEVHQVTNVIEVTEKAAKVWEGTGWNE